MTSQDFEKGIDVGALTTVSGSEFNQLVDVARTAIDKGLIITSTDSSPAVPVVPNPNAEYDDGITPTWWTRYIWLRKTFDSTQPPFLYVWFDEMESDPTYLKWYDINTVANAAKANADIALADASAAQVAANAANATATNAQTSATASAASVAALSTTLVALTTTVNGLADLLMPIGSIRMSGRSHLMNNWLLCDGSAVSRTDFADLFTIIGTVFGIGDNATTFNVPDLRGRVPVGNGAGSGLTVRAIGSNGGEETHLLTALESGLPAHTHDVTMGTNTSQSGSDNPAFRSGVTDPLTVTSAANVAAPATNAHNNMQPFLTVFYEIRAK